jgi:phage tail protein X
MQIIATEEITVSGDGITLSRLIWRRFRRAVPGLAEVTLDANPGLSSLGPILPIGTVVRLPIPQDENDTPQLDAIRLF